MEHLNSFVNVFVALNTPKKLMFGFLGFLLGFFFVYVLSQNVRIIISETDSHPAHYFINFPKSKAKLKDHVLLESNWYGKKIIKKIVGQEGDRVWYDSNQCVWINDNKIGPLKEISKCNRKLTPIPSQYIPKGYVFVYSNHESSFDSRYQELGLIPISSLRGKVFPLM